VGDADVRSEYADAAGLAGMAGIKRQAGLDQQALGISSRKEKAAWAIVYSSNMQRATHTGVMYVCDVVRMMMAQSRLRG